MDKYTYHLPFSVVSEDEPSDAKLYDAVKDVIDEGYDDKKLSGIVQLVSKIPVDREVSVTMTASRWRKVVNVLNGWQEWPTIKDEIVEEIERQVNNG